MELTAKNVNEILNETLSNESTTNAKEVEGIFCTYKFDMDRLSKYDDDILSMLHQLDDNFMKEHGGGWSLINAPFTKDGVQWGEQSTAEQLFAMGMALKMVEYLFPRILWRALPGSVPYYVIIK